MTPPLKPSGFPEPDEQEEKKLVAVIQHLRNRTKGWSWQRWVALAVGVALAVALARLGLGCTGLQQKPAPNSPSQQTGIGTPAQSDSGPATGLGSAQQQADTTAPAPTTAGPQSPAVTETGILAPKQSGIGLNNQFTFQILSGTGGTLSLIAVVLLLRGPRPPKLRACVARKMAMLLSKAVARLDHDTPAALEVKKKIAEVAEEMGMPEPEIQDARKVIGTPRKEDSA